ncbi:MAG: hypothetical protein LV473_16820 [Nitrospira sp.]|nr:hypothetical protein [Nitrospira sp.]
MSRGKILAGLVILFVAGVLCGIAGTSIYHTYEREQRGERGAAAQHDLIMTRLTQELALTAEQRTAIEPIVTRAHVAVLELRFAHQVEIEAILVSGVAALKSKLSPEQQTRLDAMYARLQRRWTKSRDYLETTKKRLTWLVPSRPPSDSEPLMRTRRGMDDPGTVNTQARLCDERNPGVAPGGCVVRIGMKRGLGQAVFLNIRDNNSASHRQIHPPGQNGNDVIEDDA